MNLVITILSVLSVLVPIADRGIARYRQLKQSGPVQIVQSSVQAAVAPQPPEAGQPGVVFHQGEWWKLEGGQWLVWRPTVQIAQGGAHVRFAR